MLNDGDIVSANTIYKERKSVFKIKGVGIDKVRVSDKKIYSKNHDSYKRYVSYEHSTEYIPLKIFVSNVTGRYNIFDDVSKTMNFTFNDDSLGKFYEKFEDIEA